MGFNVDLAPVLDVARPGSAIAAQQRSFSSDPAQVAQLGSAFIQGLHAADVAATGKHFPGFGAARVSTDLAAVTLNLPLATLRRVDELPYQAAIRSGVELVLMSSAIYPALDPQNPAGLSHKLVVGELRNHLGFQGVTLTDALGVPGITAHVPVDQIPIRAVTAGIDLQLYSEGYEQGVRAARLLAQALRQHTVARAELVQSANRVLQLRAKLAGDSSGTRADDGHLPAARSARMRSTHVGSEFAQ